MKGLLKGLRYISHIFDDDKEPEMQIGFPTDVKHVAHIGWDGPVATNSPSWLDNFKLDQDNMFGQLETHLNLSEIPKKTRRKKLKESSQDGYSKSSSRTAKAIAEASTYTCYGPALGYIPLLRNNGV